jgi:hypothetical protein
MLCEGSLDNSETLELFKNHSLNMKETTITRYSFLETRQTEHMPSKSMIA